MELHGTDKLPDIKTLLAKKKKLTLKKLFLIKKKIGINIAAGRDQSEQIATIESIMFGKCICRDMDKHDITKEEINNARKEFTNKNDKYIIKHLLHDKKCMSCDKYCDNECKFCSRPTRLSYIPYTDADV